MKNQKTKAYLIGKNISSSYSPDIYSGFLNMDYKIKNLQTEKELVEFISKKEYLFLNITAPYKKTVIDILDNMSDLVKETGVCNLIVNRGGVLKGYNTDCYGFQKLLQKNNIDVKNKTILVLGNGATSKSVKYVLKKLNAKTIYTACRHIKESTEYLFKDAPRSDIEIIINTTPLGKNINDRRLAYVSNYPKLETFVDVIYQSYKTPTMIDAKDHGVGAVNGLDMLIYQAQLACFVISKKLMPEIIFKEIKNKILLEHVNLVLIGLPTSGKTKLCKELKKLLNDKNGDAFFDTDEIIEKISKKSIAKIFDEYGEEYFRKLEKDVTKTVSKGTGKIISTGGGLVLNRENYLELSRNGFIIYLKKTNFDDFKNDGKRPLVKSKEDLYKLYKERNPIYEKRCDLSIMNNLDAKKFIEEACDAITNS